MAAEVAEMLPVAHMGTMGAEEEARSTLGTIFAQILTIVRTILAYAVEVMRRFAAWAGEHPLAAILFTTNVIIWVS